MVGEGAKDSHAWGFPWGRVYNHGSTSGLVGFRGAPKIPNPRNSAIPLGLSFRTPGDLASNRRKCCWLDHPPPPGGWGMMWRRAVEWPETGWGLAPR